MSVFLTMALLWFWLWGVIAFYAMADERAAARYRRTRAFILTALWPLSVPVMIIVDGFKSWPKEQPHE